MDQEIREPQQYLAILKRRKWQFIFPALVLFVVSVAFALMWPPVYRASALILIEEPDVPRDLVQSTISSYAAERVQVVTHRVITTSNLVGIIQKFDLFVEKRKRVSINAVVEDMREDIGLELINADVIDPRSGRPTSATIAFSLTFDHRHAITSQRVLNELVSLYMSENLRSRREKVNETTDFLTRETTKYDTLVDQLETDLANFKERNAGVLPEDLPLNIQVLDRTERELIELQRELQALTERRIYLDSQLAQIDPYAPNALTRIDGEIVMRPEERLAMLETKLLSISGIYGPEHPDVRKMTREVNALKNAVGKSGSIAELEQSQEMISNELATTRQRYSDEHPDVLKLKRQLESVRTALSEAQLATAEPNRPENPDNPAYISLASQLETVNSEARAVRPQQTKLRQKMRELEQKIARGPEVERDYLLLQRNYKNAVATYQEMKSKLTAAEIGQSLETESKSERFSLIEPPTQPEKPVKPNRLAILFIGFIFSVAAGAGSAALFESLDRSIYGLNQLVALTGVAPLVVVPHIRNRLESQGIWTRRLLVPLITITVMAIGIYAVNEFFIPLDVLLARSERRLELFLIEIGII